MAIIRTIAIDDKSVDFKASAAIPRLYRNKFNRDIYEDLNNLRQAMNISVNSETEQTIEENEIAPKDVETDNQELTGQSDNLALDSFSLEIFENIAYIMAYHANPEKIEKTVDEWLENFSTFSIYQTLPELIKLWGLNLKTTVIAKKNKLRQKG